MTQPQEVIQKERNRHTIPAKPFLKWVGGKRQVMPHLLAALPKKFNRYFEPFVGGGALFFELQPAQAYLWDSNAELIDTYIVLRDDVEGVIRHLKKHVYSKEHYYHVRSRETNRLSPAGRAARMIYLNRTGYNGLYRVNSKGQFNVPFGRYNNPLICNKEKLRIVSDCLTNVDLQTASFERVLSVAQKGDFIYLDPPYIPLSKTSNFVAYQKIGFGMDNQESLANVFEQLHNRGCCLMLSNSDVPWMKRRYGQFNIKRISATRNVNSKASQRGKVGELIVTNY